MIESHDFILTRHGFVRKRLREVVVGEDEIAITYQCCPIVPVEAFNATIRFGEDETEPVFES